MVVGSEISYIWPIAPHELSPTHLNFGLQNVEVVYNSNNTNFHKLFDS